MSEFRFRLIDLARGTDSVGLLRDLRRWQFESGDILRQRESAGLESYLSELRQAVPMFSNARRLEDLPILDKGFINAHRNELMNPAYKGKLIRKKTGGSTGEPLVYFTGTEAQSYLWAGIFLAWEAAGYRLGDKVAFLAGSSLFGTGYKQRVYYGLLNVTVLSAFDMAPVRMDEYGAELQRGGHSLLYGYASAIHRLARHWLDGGRKPQTRLRGVVCTAEMLTPLMRADIEAAFGVPCFGQYGCNDAGVSAFECEQRNGYHLISTRSHAEVMPDGRLLSTDLANRAMFLPRYDTGDLVRMSGRVCSCGRNLPLIDEIRGRQNHVVVDASGQAVHSEFFTHLLREDARVHSFQVVFDETRLVVNLHTVALSLAEEDALSAPYRARIASSLAFDGLDFVFNQPFVTLANGKHRFVMRKPVQ